jgi:hypothetical protein
MPQTMASTPDRDTSTERYGRQPRSSADAGPVSVGKQGVAIKWTSIGTVALLSLGAAWNYADARWSACEAQDRQLAAKAAEAREHAVVLAERLVAAERRADERQGDLQRQLAQIQAQLAQIQVDLRRSSK